MNSHEQIKLLQPAHASLRCVILTSALVVLVGTYICTGAVRVWTGGGGNGYWNTPANWGGTAPSQGDDLVFPAGAARLTNTNNYTGWAFNSITFSGSNYVIRGNPLTLANGISAQQPTGTNTFHPQITLGRPQTNECTAAAATLVLGTGGLKLGTNDLVFNTVGRIVADGVITGSGRVTKTGTGTLAYTADYNDYTGLTYVSRGVLELNCDDPDAALGGIVSIGDGTNSATVRLMQSYELPDNALVFIYANGTLDLNNYSDDIGTVTLIGGAVTTGTGTLTLNGDILSLASTSTATISGKLDLGGYTRTIYVAASALDPELIVSAVISNGGVKKTGPGNVRFSGANTYAGLTTIEEGFIILAHGSALGSTTTGTVLAGGSLAISGVSVGYEPLTNNSANSVLKSSGAALWEGGIVLNTNLVVQTLSGSTLRLAGAIVGLGGLTKDDPGTLRFAGTADNFYTGPTVVKDGVLELYKISLGRAIGSGSLTVGDGIGAAGSAIVRYLQPFQLSLIPVTIAADGRLDLNNHDDDVGPMTLIGGEVETGTGMLDLYGDLTVQPSAQSAYVYGKLRFIGGQRTVYVGDGEAENDLDMYAAVSDAGDGLVVSNATPVRNFVRFFSSNSFTGPLTIANVRLVARSPWALGATNGATIVRTNSTLWLYLTGITNELITLHGGAELVAQNNCTLAGPVNLASGNISISVFPETVTLDILGQISGAGGCTKVATGKLRFSGAVDNTYTGPTYVHAGVLELNKSSAWRAISSGSLTVGDGVGEANADIVRYEGTSTDQIQNTVPIIITASGLLDLNNHSDTVSNITMTGGRISTGTGKLSPGNITATAAGFAKPAVIQGNLELTATRTFTTLPGPYSPALIVAANVSGSGGLIKTGLYGMILSGSNSYAGLTQIAQDQLEVGNSYALGLTNSGTVVSNGAGLILYDGVDVGNESLTLAGPGASPAGALWVGNGMVASWAGQITLATDTVIGVIGTNGQLTLSGQITGPGGLSKLGEGTLVLTGSSTNNYAGDTWVREGTLRFAKTASGKAITKGTLIVGDDLGGPLADRVVWAAAHQLDERYWPLGGFNGVVPVVVNSSGWLNLNGFYDVVAGLTMHAGRVDTGTGTLVLDGDVTADSTSTNMAIIDGELDLRTITWGLLPGIRTFNVTGTNSLLGIRAQVRGMWTGLCKAGTGELSLSASNSFDLVTIVSNGVLSITHPYALGATNIDIAPGANTIVYPGGSLVLSGFGVQVAGEPLVLMGDGFGGQGALRTADPAASNFWSGTVTISNDTRINVAAGTMLNLNCAIDGPGGFTKIGTGTLSFTGTNANSYAGITRVHAGTLELRKGTAALNAGVPGRLEISNATVRLLANSQIDNDADVHVAGVGVLDLNNWGEAIDELSGDGTVQLGSGYLNVCTGNGSSSFAGRITGMGNLTKFGTGTLTLSGDNSYTGVTTVREGTLVVNGGQPQSPVTVQAGATLRGNGWIGPLTVSGRVHPGQPGAVTRGVLSCSNVVFYSSGRLTSTLYSDGSDKLDVAGTVQLGNATLELTRQTEPWLGQRFWLIDNDGSDPVSGTFAGLPEGATVMVDGVQLQLSYKGGSSNDVMLTFTNPPLGISGVQISWGDGDGELEPGDCSLLTIHLTNRTGTEILDTVASVLPGAPGSGNYPVDGLWLPHWQSPYPALPVNAAASNLVPFQIWLGTNWPFGQPVRLSVKLATTNHGAFVLPLDLPTGGLDASFSGGPCELCPADFRITALLSSTAPVQQGQLSKSAPSSCLEPVVCPGVKDTRPRYYHAYRFINGESLACITVTLTPTLVGSGQLFSAAYLEEFNPKLLCANFLGTAGAQGNASYSFMVGPRQRFVVVVNQYPTNFIGPVSYTLQVTNGSCQPWLEIERPNAEAVAVKWTSAAVEHQLESTPALSPPIFELVTNQPVVVDGKCTVTNQPAGEARFYRLRAEQ